MSHRKKNSNDLSRFLKYTGNGMKGKERNSFERELQKDSFEAEAAEGLSMVTPKEARDDLNSIEKRLKVRSGKRKFFTPMRIAATLALLIGTTIIFTLLRNNKEQPLVSEVIKPQKTITIPESKAVIREPVTEDKKVAIGSSISEEQKAAAPIQTESEGVEFAMEEVTANEVVKGEQKDKELLDTKMISKPEAAVIRSAEMKRTDKKRIISGVVISNDDKEPIPGAIIAIKGTDKGAISDAEGRFSLDVNTDSSLLLVARFIGMTSQEIRSKPDTSLLIAMNTDQVALDEVVVVGYGISRKESQTGSVSSVKAQENEYSYVHFPPEPSDGDKQFRDYIESNIHYPENFQEKTRVTVVISMTVLRNGDITDIKIVRSPSQVFSDEAIRLIKEGPSWKPATLNGTPQNEEIKVRIVFKPR